MPQESGFDKIAGPVFTDQRAFAKAVGWHKPGTVSKASGVLAVPVTHGVVTMVTGGAEALTLADGEPGQKITMSLVTDGGDGTLTPSRKTGFSTVVFSAVGQTATLKYVDDSIGWIIEGAAAVAVT